MGSMILARPIRFAVALGIALLPITAHAAPMLTLERTNETYGNGDPIWLLKLSDGSKPLARWQAAAGATSAMPVSSRSAPTFWQEV